MGFKESIARINTGIATAIFTTCIAISAIACQSIYKPVDNERLTDYLRNRDLADLIQHMRRCVKEKYNLLPSTHIGGSKSNPIKGVRCSFDADNLRFNEAEARTFMVSVIDSLINAINSYPRSKEILIEFPFPTRRLGVTVFFDERSKHDSVPAPFIGGIRLRKDRIIYMIYNKDENKYEEILDESLEEARQKIALSQPNN